MIPNSPVMPENFGTEEITAEDRAYRGSRFADVRDAIFDNPYVKVWRGEPDTMPRHEVPFTKFLTGIPPLAGPYVFRKAVERTVDSHADLRWGKDGTGFLRFIHANGICLTGLWEIAEPNPYSGYFRKGSKALCVGRYSSASETRRGHTRSLALVGKLYPSADPEHPEPLRTASFFTQQDLGGDFTPSLNDVETRNAPDVRAWRRGLDFPILGLEAQVFGSVDREPTIRQLYEIAELGKPADEPTRTPKYMRLKIAEGHRKSDHIDFRDEIMAFIYDKGDPVAKRTLTFNIDVTDEGSERGPDFFKTRTFSNWRHVGRLTFAAAVASINGDRVLHFHHPTWRTDPNDPSTATRQNEKKVSAR